ncbi:MAG: FG-GAP-like repeat-containing protein [Bacteroidales bacterium]|nr:FG-GAP-like repeat-containing protein [Bacteroidales bacterium]
MKNILLTAALLLVAGVSYAQDDGTRDVITGENIVLDYELPAESDNMVMASNEIRLKPGFRAKNTGDNETALRIDGYAVVPPESGLFGGSSSNNEGGVVGAIGGTVDVSSLGGATYTIPIEVPSGINGMQPSIAITYNSQAGGGLLGYGWDLSGISSITRTGSTLYHDGKMTAADFSGGDRFLLDGQRLIKVGEGGGYEEYKTEQDEFSKIIFYKDGDEFSRCEVWQENGCVVYYGSADASDNSRLMTPDGSHVMKWMVSRVEDRNGNAMTYDYHNNQNTGEIHIRRICYTSNSTAKVSAEFDVSFDYEDTDDNSCSFIGGCRMQHTKILKGIKASRQGSEIVSYGFSYDKAVSSRLLNKVSVRKDGVCVNPTLIRWRISGNGNEYNRLSETEIDTAILKKMTFQGDFNGDGYTDLLTVPYKRIDWAPAMEIYLNDRSGGFPSEPDFGMPLPDSLEWVHIADLNGDGYDDVIVQTEDIHKRSCTTTVTIYESRFDGLHLGLEQVYAEEEHNRLLLKTGDFIGIGKTCLLAIPLDDEFFNMNEDGTHVIHHDGGYNKTILTSGHAYSISDEAIVHAGDYDGDGLSELLVYEKYPSGALSVIASFDAGNGEVAVEDTFLKNIRDVVSLYPGDFNGDGKTDVLYYVPTGYTKGVFVALSNGTGFDVPRIVDNDISQMVFPQMSLYDYSFDNVDPDLSCGISVTDIDGDGKSDVVWYHDESTVFLRDYSTHSHKFMAVCNKDKDEVRFLNKYFTIGNFMGHDDLSFISTNASQEGKAYISWFKSVAELLSVTGITDGMGGTTDIVYDYLMPGSGVYTFSNAAAGDVRSIPVPILAMKSSTSAHGGTSETTSYRYADAMFHRTGKGLLGFSNVRVQTSVNGTRTGLQSSNCGLSAVADGTVMVPLNDTAYVYMGVQPVPSESHEYRLCDVRNSLNPLVIRPAMSSYVTKVFDINSPGNVLSTTIEEYAYSYSRDNSYENTYHCVKTVTGVGDSSCGSAESCGHVTVAEPVFMADNYGDWVINRKEKDKTTVKMSGNDNIVKSSLYSYTSGNPFLRTSVTDCPGADLRDPKTVTHDYVYDVFGNVVRETVSAPFGSNNTKPFAVEYHYDASGRNVVSKTTDPDGLRYTETYGYDIRDRMTSSTSVNGLVTLYRYDNAFGSTVTTISPTGLRSVEALRWTDGNDLAPDGSLYYRWCKSSAGTQGMTFHDGRGNVLRTVTYNHKSEPVMTDMEYDSRGRLRRQSDPYTGGSQTWTVMGYDNAGRMTYIATPDGTRTSITYSGMTATTMVETADGVRTTSETANCLGWTVCSTDASGASVSYDYYPDGRLKTAVTSGGRVKLTAEYDNAGNRTSLTDPDYGRTTSLYDTFGRLLEQTTPKGKTTRYTYDVMGRVTSRVEDAGGSPVSCVYIYNETDGLKGTLLGVDHDNETVRYTYDEFLRPVMTEQSIGGETFSTVLEYDGLSRVAAKTYPSGYTVKYTYYPTGLKHTIEDSDGNLLWRTDDVNQTGQLLKAFTGNGAKTLNEYDGRTHRLLRSYSYNSSGNFQDFVYRYDKFGNLAARKDSITGMSETFTYDGIDRLTGVKLNGKTRGRMEYDGYGRMTLKLADGKMLFDNAEFSRVKPHAMSGATFHDPVLADVGQTIEYTSFDKLSMMKDGRGSISYVYGIDNQRVGMTERLGSGVRTKKYVGSCEFITEKGTEKVLTYLTGPYGVFAVVVEEAGVESIHYICKDHLGSWTTITDSDGNVEQRQSFDAWGNRRNSKTWSGPATDEPMFDRGFTGHEHLYAFGLINMNGRMYDPVTSSFLSPDNYVQDPTSQQGFNRYAYCFYNPLKYVDPTGERASGPDFRMMAAMIERMIREQCYNKWRDFLMGMGCISMIDINGSWGEFGWCKGISGSGNSGGGSSIAPKNENGEMIADTSGPMVGDGDHVSMDADGNIIIEYENGIKETRYSDGRILIHDVISNVGYIVADQSSTQWANFNMNYNILYNPNEQSIYISCLSSNSEVMAGDIFAGAGATVIAGDEYSRYESLSIDNQAHLYGEDWNYVGSAKFMVPSNCGYIQVNMEGNWSINTGYGITLPTIAPLCPYPINANKKYYIKP